MPVGDQGGTVTQLILTMVADQDISKGDPLALVGEYLVGPGYGELFGQAMKAAKKGDNLPVLVRGIAIFPYDVPYAGRVAMEPDGLCASNNGPRVLRNSDGQCHVLL